VGSSLHILASTVAWFEAGVGVDAADGALATGEVCVGSVVDGVGDVATAGLLADELDEVAGADDLMGDVVWLTVTISVWLW
jgi:hypothetical protein